MAPEVDSMTKRKKRTLPLGSGGELKLPPDVLEALGIEPEDKEVEIFLDKRRKQLRLERHVDDPWAEALRQKPEKGLEDLMEDQAQREADAKELFERRLKEPPPERRPEDDPDYWR
jgi:antitoxin component of MazEF toxin-antitoxin module